MASSLPIPVTAPKTTLKTPRIAITEGDRGEEDTSQSQSLSFSFSFTCDEVDDHNKQDSGHEPTIAQSSLLHPHSRTNSLLRPPTPEATFAMSTDDVGTGNPNSGSSPAKNPFNFQTQFMDAAGPVKSVRLNNPFDIPSNPANQPSPPERRPTQRPSLQTQLHQRLPPSLPRTPTTTSPSPPGLSPHPNL